MIRVTSHSPLENANNIAHAFVLASFALDFISISQRAILSRPPSDLAMIAKRKSHDNNKHPRLNIVPEICPLENTKHINMGYNCAKLRNNATRLGTP
jgi:hypothetical protein